MTYQLFMLKFLGYFITAFTENEKPWNISMCLNSPSGNTGKSAIRCLPLGTVIFFQICIAYYLNFYFHPSYIFILLYLIKCVQMYITLGILTPTYTNKIDGGHFKNSILSFRIPNVTDLFFSRNIIYLFEND